MPSRGPFVPVEHVSLIHTAYLSSNLVIFSECDPQLTTEYEAILPLTTLMGNMATARQNAMKYISYACPPLEWFKQPLHV